MINTEYKLSETKNCRDALDNAARIVAKSALDGAIENQQNNDLPVNFDELNTWGFKEIVDCYLGADTVLDCWFGCGEEVTIEEPEVGNWHDVLIIDIDDREAYQNVLDLAKEKMKQYALKIIESNYN